MQKYKNTKIQKYKASGYKKEILCSGAQFPSRQLTSRHGPLDGPYTAHCCNIQFVENTNVNTNTNSDTNTNGNTSWWDNAKLIDGAQVINITNVVDNIKEEVDDITYQGENQIRVVDNKTRMVNITKRNNATKKLNVQQGIWWQVQHKNFQMGRILLERPIVKKLIWKSNWKSILSRVPIFLLIVHFVYV